MVKEEKKKEENPAMVPVVHLLVHGSQPEFTLLLGTLIWFWIHASISGHFQNYETDEASVGFNHLTGLGKEILYISSCILYV